MAGRPSIDRRRLRLQPGMVVLVCCFAAVLIATTVAALIGKTRPVTGGIVVDMSALTRPGEPQAFNAELYLQPHVTAQILSVRLNPVPGYPTGHLVHLATNLQTFPLDDSYYGWPPRLSPTSALPIGPFPETITGAGLHYFVYSILADRPGPYEHDGITITYRVGAITHHLIAGSNVLLCVPTCNSQTYDIFDSGP